MLSDLYVPADTDPASPRLDGQLNDEDFDNGPQSGMEYGGGANGSTDEKLYEGDGLFGSDSTFMLKTFHYQLMHIMLKNTELLKHSKITLQHVSVYAETIFRELQSVLG